MATKGKDNKGKDNYEPWVTGKEICRLFSISPSKLNRMVHGNPPLPHKRIGRTFRYRISDVERFIDKYGEGIADFQHRWDKKK